MFAFTGSFMRRCNELFPYRNKNDELIMATEKMHSIRHAANDVARWADAVNTNTEAPESGHKNWVKKQGGKTNQGPAAQLSMMKHSERKAASALCCEAVQGSSQEIMHNYHNVHNMHNMHNTFFLQHELMTMTPIMKLMTGHNLIHAAIGNKR